MRLACLCSVNLFSYLLSVNVRKVITLLCRPCVRNTLNLVKSGLQSSNLSISFCVCGHKLRSCFSSSEDLEVVDTVFVKCKNLLIKSLDFSKISWLGESLSGGFLCSNQPRCEFLDTSSVLGPEFDIVGVFVTLNSGLLCKVHDILCDSGKLILEGLGISGNLVTLGKKFQFCCGISLEDFNFGSNVFLEVHCSGNSVLWEHVSRCLLDIIELSGGRLHPGINSLQILVKLGERINKLLNLLNCLLEASIDFKFCLNSLDFLGEDFLLVLRNCDCHAVIIGIDGIKESINCVIALIVDLLSLLQISNSSLKVKVLLHLLNFLFSNVKFIGNCLIVFSISNESILGLKVKVLL